MALRSEFDIFDRSKDPALDELCELAAVLCGADYAFIGWMDYNRLWFKSRFGFQATEQPWASTACQWMLEIGEPLLIRDASQDPRFPPEGIPLAGAQTCRSYVGVPLTTSEHQFVGTLAVLAREPNRFSVEHGTFLQILGRQTITRIELYMRTRAQEHAQRERQRAERALAVERCFVAATLDSIPALVAVLDTAGRIVRMNSPCTQLTGLSMTEAIGRPFVEVVLAPEDRGWAAEKLRAASTGLVSGPHETAWHAAGHLLGEPSPGPTLFDAQMPYSLQSGALATMAPPAQVRRVSWTLRPLSGPDGEIQYLIVSGQDVTEQREMELALASSETRYREMVENSLGFVFTCSMDGRLTSLNSLTAQTLGYRMEDLTGRSLNELLDGEGMATFQECLEALSSREEWQGALPLRRSDGVFRRIALRSRRMELPGERPFALNHGIDVTEQHESEQALHMAMRQRELILESVGDGIFGIDLDGLVTFVNQAAARALGYSPERLTGRPMHETIQHSHADGTPALRASSAILEGLQRNEMVRITGEVFWRQNGTSFPVDYSATPLVEGGRISGMVVAFQDVSERRRLEKMKDEFISTVSHELRTPLTSLRASLGLLATGTLEKRPEKRGQMIEMAIGNCDRLVKLVNNILDFEGVRKGKLPLDRQAVDAAILLRRAADVAHSAALQAHINFRIEAKQAVVMADEERILQVLNELVTNAIKFSPPQTTIRLSAKPAAGAPPAEAQNGANPAEICFRVEDQGRGIPAENLEGIFDRFQQGDASDSRDLGGTGLGLALCRSIVEQHGGRMWAESTPGKGSCLLFTLPVAE
jgi:PAS domain S-box-containing protein